MKVTAEQYGDICDVVYRASQNWPLIPDDANPFRHTSDVARAAANRIIGILGLEHEDLELTPELLRAMADYHERHQRNG
jgi:hypothetical protein